MAQYQCPKLKTTNYTVWAIQIKVILEAHGLWEAIEPKENTQVDNKKDKATTAFLYQALTEDVILQVASCKTAKELWESLKKRHVGEEKVQQARLQSLMIGFNTLQMKDEDTVDAFTARLNGYATKAKELGKTLDESLLVRKLLDSTPDRFIQIVASIEQTSDLDDITLDEITGKLKAFEERIKLRKGGQAESQDNLLFAQGEHSGKGRRFSKRGGRSNFSRGNWQNSRRGNSNHKGNSTRNKGEWDLSKVRCHRCKKFGHLRRDCRGTSTTQEQSNLILEDDEPSLLMTTHEEVLLNEGQIQPGKYASGDASMWYLELRDRGGEFTSNEFTKYCKENGIARQLTAPYSPQQNGVVERRNRTVLSTTRSMMKAMKLPLTFWAEAVRHAIYILNRVPTRALENKTPLTGTLPTENRIWKPRIFGCTALCTRYNTSLEEAGMTGRAYQVSRDVKFMETKPWDWDKDGEDTRTQDTFRASFVVEGVDNENATPDAREVEVGDLLLMEEEPRNYKEASTDEKWIEAMEIELDSINKNNTWTLTTLPPDQKAIGLKWVYKTRRGIDKRRKRSSNTRARFR
ncbi:zinc finger, CCHC-type containing protein [Tanacetum coccineum]